MDKYAKIVLLSTLAEPKTLVDISIAWFQNKGRLYQPQNTKAIQELIKQGLLIQDGKIYQANVEKLLDYLLEDSEKDKIFKQYKEWLKYFYNHLKDYTRKVYLNFEVIKALTKLDHDKIPDFDLRLLIQLPFLLRFIEQTNKTIANLLIQAMKLEDYVKTIEKLEIQHYNILKEQRITENWVESFERLSQILPKMQKKELNIFEKNIKAMKTLSK